MEKQRVQETMKKRNEANYVSKNEITNEMEIEKKWKWVCSVKRRKLKIKKHGN